MANLWKFSKDQYIKSFQRWSFCWSVFSCIQRYSTSLRIQSECGKIRIRKNSVFRHFPRSGSYFHRWSEVFKSPIWDTWTICNLDSIETNTGIQQREYFKCEAWLLIWFKEVQYGHTSHNTPIYLFKVITTTSAFFYFLWRCCVDLEQINTCWESNVWREESLTRVQILQCLRGHAPPPCRRQYIDSSTANITHCIWLSKPRASHLLTKYSTQPLLIRILMMPHF